MNIAELLSLPELKENLIRVDESLRSTVAAQDPMLSEVAGHLIIAGGKRLRPSMTVAAALTCVDPPISDDVIMGAVAVELVHIGSLYHDDVLDEAATRRTVPSVNARWGNFMAVISGDYLLAKASGIAASLGTDVAGLLAATIGELCEGQVRELAYNHNPDRTVEAYSSCIAGKTASLIAAAARIGAITARLPQPEVEALTTFGYGFGMAFQVRDDILDIIWTDEQLGKPAGNDLVEGVYTLPVIYALEDPEIGPELRPLLGGPLDVAARDGARELVRRSNGVARAVETGRKWVVEATGALASLPKSDMTGHLADLVNGTFDDVATYA